MPQRAGVNSKSKRAGVYQSAKPLTETAPMIGFVTLDTGPNQPTYWWNAAGKLFEDHECTRPAGDLWIMSVPREFSDDEDDE
jgi:hypothetical protein